MLIYEAQRGYCGTCHRHFSINDMVPDHNHATGRVRGLLCRRCNQTEGFLSLLIQETSRDVASAIVDWIERDGFEGLDETIGEAIYVREPSKIQRNHKRRRLPLLEK
jgi:hypothetical protein